MIRNYLFKLIDLQHLQQLKVTSSNLTNLLVFSLYKHDVTRFHNLWSSSTHAFDGLTHLCSPRWAKAVKLLICMKPAQLPGVARAILQILW